VAPAPRRARELVFENGESRTAHADTAHGALSGCQRGSREHQTSEQVRDEEQRDHGDAEAQPRQSKLGQQRDRALTAAAQVATNADDAVKSKIHQRAAIEAVAAQRLSALALGTAIRIGDLFGVPLDSASEWVGSASVSFPGVFKAPRFGCRGGSGDWPKEPLGLPRCFTSYNR